MLMLSDGKYLGNGILHIWLTLWQIYCLSYTTTATRSKFSLQTIEINHSFLYFNDVVFTFWYVISYNLLIRKCCMYEVQALLTPLSMVLKLHTLGFWKPCSKVTVHKPEGTQHVGKPNWRWFESVGEDLKNVGLRNRRYKSQGREQWRAILKEAKIHQ